MNTKKSTLFTKFFSLLVVSLLFLVAVPVNTASAAADIYVTTKDDLVVLDGLCSLREAVINANTDSHINADCESGHGFDTIYLRSRRSYRLYQGSLNITDPDGLKITSTGSVPATINARDSYRALFVKDTGGNLTLDNLIVLRGFSSNGSAIRFSSPGSLTLVDSTITDNVATAGGNCGAGIYSLTASSISIIRSSIANNTCTADGADGGGILYKNMNGDLSIINSTFYNNSAGPGSHGNGGGMDILVASGTINFSTFSNNTVSGDGGAAKLRAVGTIMISNSIMANSNGGADCWRTGGVVDSSSSLIETNSGSGACYLFGGSSGFTSDPGLGIFQDNGGSSFTMSITNTSPAYNAADGCIGIDQRGVARPQFNDCDLGAFELDNNDLTHTDTSVSCANPVTYGSDSACEVTVTPDSGDVSGATVSWSTNANGSFSTSQCTLVDNLNGTASCSVTYTPGEVGGGIHWISAAYPGDSTYDGSIGTQGLTVAPKELTVSGVTADDKVYDGTTTATLNTAGAALVGVLGSDVVGLDASSAIGTFDTKDVGTGKTVTASGFVLNGADAGNYSLTQPATTADITPAELIVTADDKWRPIYISDPVFTFSAAGFFSPDTFDTDPACDVPVLHEDMGTYDIICSGGDAGANYTITYVAGTLTVTESNLPPTGISLSNDSVEENQPVGTLIGTFTTTDPNLNDIHTYSFCGGADDASFTIDADTLRTGEVFDYEAKSYYSICVRTDDGWGETFDETFPINITDGKPVLVTFKSQAKYDGWVLESGEFSGKGGTKNNKGKVIQVGDNLADKQYRAILSFGTAKIPDNAVVTRVILKVKKAGVVGTDPMTTHNGLFVDIRKNKFSTLPALQINDFQANANKYKVGKFPNKRFSGWYKSILNSGAYSVINLKGRTQLRLRFLLDDNDDNSADILKLYSGNAVLANRPQLIVEYYIP